MKAAFNFAKEQFLRYAALLDLDRRFPAQHLARRLTVPDRSVEAPVGLERDNGEVLVTTGYRVQFNDDRGPYKGGLRFHPVVDLEEVKALAFWMYLKRGRGHPLRRCQRRRRGG